MQVLGLISLLVLTRCPSEIDAVKHVSVTGIQTGTTPRVLKLTGVLSDAPCGDQDVAFALQSPNGEVPLNWTGDLTIIDLAWMKWTSPGCEYDQPPAIDDLKDVKWFMEFVNTPSNTHGADLNWKMSIIKNGVQSLEPLRLHIVATIQPKAYVLKFTWKPFLSVPFLGQAKNTLVDVSFNELKGIVKIVNSSEVTECQQGSQAMKVGTWTQALWKSNCEIGSKVSLAVGPIDAVTLITDTNAKPLSSYVITGNDVKDIFTIKLDPA